MVVVPPEQRKSENREGESQSPSAAEEGLSMSIGTSAEASDSTLAVRPGRKAKIRTEPEMAFNFKLPVSLARLVHEEALRRKTRREPNATIVGVFTDLVRQHLSRH